MINPETIDKGRVFLVLLSGIFCWVFGVLCGVVGFILIEDRRENIRRQVFRERVAATPPTFEPVANFTTTQGRRGPLAPRSGANPRTV